MYASLLAITFRYHGAWVGIGGYGHYSLSGVRAMEGDGH